MGAQGISWQLMAQQLVPEAWKHAAALTGSQKRSIYLVFSALLPIVRQAHERSDRQALARAYAFAEWCAHHESKGVWNAAGVAFYEHLFDQGIAPREIVPWLSPEIYADVRGLIALHHGEPVARNVDRAMNERTETNAAGLGELIERAQAGVS